MLDQSEVNSEQRSRYPILLRESRQHCREGSEGPLGTSSGVGHVVLSEEDGKTTVTYDYAIKLSGTVASVGGRMLEGAAKALVKQFFNRLTAQITGQKDSGSIAGISTNGLWAFIKRILGLKS